MIEISNRWGAALLAAALVSACTATASTSAFRSEPTVGVDISATDGEAEAGTGGWGSTGRDGGAGTDTDGEPACDDDGAPTEPMGHATADYAPCIQPLNAEVQRCQDACPGADGSTELWRCHQECSLSYYTQFANCCVAGRIDGDPIRFNGSTPQGRSCRANLCWRDLTSQHVGCMNTLDCREGDPDFDRAAHIRGCDRDFFNAGYTTCNPDKPSSMTTGACDEGMRPKMPAGQPAAGDDAVTVLGDNAFVRREAAQAFLTQHWSALFDHDVPGTAWDERKDTPCRIRFIETLIADETDAERRRRLDQILDAITH